MSIPDVLRIPRADIPRPLVRSTLTIAPLESPAVSVEVVVTDDEGETDFPELQGAGWGRHVLDNLTVHFRIVS